jgi:hypothetical protein
MSRDPEDSRRAYSEVGVGPVRSSGTPETSALRLITQRQSTSAAGLSAAIGLRNNDGTLMLR